MTAEQLVQLLTEIPFIGIFVVAVFEFSRHRSRAKLDTVLFFGALALVVLSSWLRRGLDADPEWLQRATVVVLMALPYLLVRLVGEFAGVPRWIHGVALAGLAASAATLLLIPADDLPLAAVLAMAAYFVVLVVYAAVRFAQSGRRRRGPSGLRMVLAAVGCALLGAVIAFSGLSAAFPAAETVFAVLGRLSGLASAVAYLLAFAPPGVLRRAWQEPHLHRFLERASELPHLTSPDDMVVDIEERVMTAVGADAAALVVWNEEERRLEPAVVRAVPPDYDLPIASRVFAEQRAVFVPDAPAALPEYAETLRAIGAGSVMAAPVTAGSRRFGVLAVYSAHAPLFSLQELRLVEMFAAQVAFVLHSRATIEEEAELRAREESVRLKEDFLSAAAHDLRTPLTTLVGQAQLMERRALRNPGAPPDIDGIRRLVHEAARMRSLVSDLLDASRAEEGEIVGELEAVDLAELVREAVQAIDAPHHPVRVEADEAWVKADRMRIGQLVDNLVGNAIKYTPEGGEVRVRVVRSGESVCLEVQDRGIGIAPDEQARVFERFWRSARVDDRQFSGMGLGLYICRRIVEGHGGEISVESRLGAGSTFKVRLPLAGIERGTR